MTTEELDMFIKSINLMFKLKLNGADPRIHGWTDQFKKMDYQVANKMALLYYNRGEIKYHEVRPKHIMEMYDEARRALGYIVAESSCDYCRGQGLVNVKRYTIGKGWHDYAYRCFCSEGNRVYQNFLQLKRDDLADFEQIQKRPARYADPHMYKEGKRQSEIVTSEMIQAITPKRYSQSAIDRFKEKCRNARNDWGTS